MTPPSVTLVIPCHNGGAQALRALAHFEPMASKPSPVAALAAIVVDDGSDDGSQGLLRSGMPRWARLACMPRNRGRGAAINLGVAQADSELVLVLDCDCVPAAPAGARGLLDAHLAAIRDADASIGEIANQTRGFWGRYQSRVARRRSAAARRGIDGVLALTSANMMVRRRAFVAVGGFDERYDKYGFEDRDLLLRLHAGGARLVHSPSAVVDHADALDLPGICRKLHASGRHSARRFREDHPRAYASSGYAPLDAGLHPLRAAMAVPLARLAVRHAGRIDGWLADERIPFVLKAALARVASGLAYLLGTSAGRADRGD